MQDPRLPSRWSECSEICRAVRILPIEWDWSIFLHLFITTVNGILVGKVLCPGLICCCGLSQQCWVCWRDWSPPHDLTSWQWARRKLRSFIYRIFLTPKTQKVNWSSYFMFTGVPVGGEQSVRRDRDSQRHSSELQGRAATRSACTRRTIYRYKRVNILLCSNRRILHFWVQIHK